MTLSDEFNIHYGVWIGYLCILLPTFLINFIVFILISYSPLLYRSDISNLINYLALEDALFSYLGVIQTFAYLGFVQEDNIGCQLHSIFISFFVFYLWQLLFIFPKIPI